MKIDKVDVYGGNVNFADKIDKIVYNQDLGISKEQFSELMAGIKGLAAGKQRLIEHDFREMSAAGEQERLSIAERIRTFLIANAIPVAHSLTATAIFELARMFA